MAVAHDYASVEDRNLREIADHMQTDGPRRRCPAAHWSWRNLAGHTTTADQRAQRNRAIQRRREISTRARSSSPDAGPPTNTCSFRRIPARGQTGRSRCERGPLGRGQAPGPVPLQRGILGRFPTHVADPTDESLPHHRRMPEQLTLPGWDEPPAPSRHTNARTRHKPRYKLFVAVFPQTAVAQAIAQRTGQWCQQHGLRASLLDAARLHVTLHVIGDYDERPAQSVVSGAMAGLASVDLPALNTRWDHLLSFPGNGALVLRCDARSDLAIAGLRDATHRALAIQRIDARPSSTPHMTLLYDRAHLVPAHPIEPFCWAATEITLILSHLGQHLYQCLGRWPLRTTST